jgi:hypothetical protein
MSRHQLRYMSRERAWELAGIAFAVGCLIVTYLAVLAATY